MKKDLNHFLFKMEVDIKGVKEKKSFFRFQSELAEALVQSPGHYFGSKSQNIRPYINQVLKPGDAAYEKPMSEKLREQILVVLKERLSEEDPLYPILEEELANAYNVLKEKNKDSGGKLFSDDFEEFSLWGLRANKVVSIIDRPGEVYWSAEGEKKSEIDALLVVFFEKIFKNFDWEEKDITSILKTGNLKIKSTINKGNSFAYRFYVSNYSVGITIWQKLCLFLAEEKLSDLNISKTKKIRIAANFLSSANYFKSPNRGESISFVNVFKVDSYITAIPLVYFQSSEGLVVRNEAKLYEEAYIINLQEEVISRVMKLSPTSKEAWKESVYFYLNNSSIENKFGSEEIRFEDFEHDIINLIDIPEN
ncbi:hypothetical protein [Aquimarina algiphila]|uniref:hypothetical protein n=1 Tax=Aquimarina algiphila TaxID=2047982 RepID=UPI002492551E|nr:hypothetical protein [Aquimarina algiphila]